MRTPREAVVWEGSLDLDHSPSQKAVREVPVPGSPEAPLPRGGEREPWGAAPSPGPPVSHRHAADNPEAQMARVRGPQGSMCNGQSFWLRERQR